MDQQQSRVRFPLRLKLVVGVVGLLGCVIAFLMIATVTLIQNDKRAYIYQSQLLEGSLTQAKLEKSLNTAHQVPKLGASLGTWFQQQNELDAVLAFKLDAQRGLKAITTRLQREGFPLDFDFSPKWLTLLNDELKPGAWAYANLSGPGGKPYLGALHVAPDATALWVVVLPLQAYVKELRETQLTVADRKGRVLIDSDPSVLFGQVTLDQDPLFKAAAASQVESGALEYATTEDWLGSYHRVLDGIWVFHRTRWSDAMRGTRAVLLQFFLLGLATIGISIVAALLFARSLSQPLARLFDGTRQIGEGNFQLNIPRTSQDELGALSVAFNAMSKKIQDLIVESMERVRLQGELAIASTVQQNLIPDSIFRDERLTIHSHYASASECGGDWWGFFNVGSRTAIMIADATGHGIPSALITAAARSCFSVIHKMAQEDPNFVLSPASLLQFANRSIYESAGGKIMMTFFAACVDHQKQILTYANAGHNPPWLFQNPNGTTKPAMKSLVAKGTRLGERSEMEMLEEASVQIHPDDLLFLYTDGLTEAKDKDDRMFGKKAVLKLVESHLKDGPEKTLDALIAAYRAHNGDKPLNDDVTMAIARFHAT